MLLPLFVGVVVLYDNRVSLIGTPGHHGHPAALEPALETPVRVGDGHRAGDPRLGDRARRRPRPGTAAVPAPGPGDGRDGGVPDPPDDGRARAAGGAGRGGHRSAHAARRRRVHRRDPRSRGAADARQRDRGHGAAQRATIPRGRAGAPAGWTAGRSDRGDGQLAGAAVHDVRHRARTRSWCPTASC